MLVAICSGISVFAFMVSIFITSFSNRNKNWKLIKNLCLVIVAFAQLIVMQYSNLGGGVGNFWAMYMAFWLMIDV